MFRYCLVRNFGTFRFGESFRTLLVGNRCTDWLWVIMIWIFRMDAYSSRGIIIIINQPTNRGEWVGWRERRQLITAYHAEWDILTRDNHQMERTTKAECFFGVRWKHALALFVLVMTELLQVVRFVFYGRNVKIMSDFDANFMN